MAAYGIPQEDIGKAIGCSHVTLRRYYRADLDVAVITANAKVSEILYANATNPDHKYQASRFFWLKCRAGWREVQRVEHVGVEDAAPVDVRVVYPDQDIPE